MAGFLAIQYGLPLYAAHKGGAIAQAFAQSNPVSFLAWAFLGGGALASLAAWFGAAHNRRLLDTQQGLDSIAELGWRDFERLVGEAFRRQGYAVEESGLGGADGGIDLILRRDGQRILVQCKHWRRRKVPVNVVREMYGLLGHHGAHAVRIATVGGFTPDAARFALGKPIDLIDGKTLLQMIRAVQVGDVAPPSERIEPVIGKGSATSPVPACPRCGQQMVERTNRRSGSVFWGCPAYPECRVTR